MRKRDEVGLKPNTVNEERFKEKAKMGAFERGYSDK